jgi:zinc transport system substrate-binding protein
MKTKMKTKMKTTGDSADVAVMTTNRMMTVDRLGHLLTGMLAACLGLAAGCQSQSSSAPDSPSSGQPVVVVTTWPLQFFAGRIGGNEIRVIFPAGADPAVDPGQWRPTTDAVTTMQQADRVVTNGAGFESWLPMVSLSESAVLDTSGAFRDRLLERENEIVHQHGPEGEHSHRQTASVTWLNPELAVLQARALCDEFSRLDPAHQSEFRERFELLEKQLRELRAELIRLAPQLRGTTILSSTPVYQYLQQACEVPWPALRLDPDREPSSDQWAEIDAAVSGGTGAIMLWPDQPLASTQAALESRGIRVVLFDLLTNLPAEGDFISAMRKNIQRLQLALNVASQ